MTSVNLTRRCVLFGWKHFAKTRTNSLIYSSQRQLITPVPQISVLSSSFIKSRFYSTQKNEQSALKPDEDDSTDKDKDKEAVKKEEDVKKMGLFKKFKQMYRDYWYVLIPVHVATSTCWAGLFYYVAKR